MRPWGVGVGLGSVGCEMWGGGCVEWYGGGTHDAGDEQAEQEDADVRGSSSTAAAAAACARGHLLCLCDWGLVTGIRGGWIDCLDGLVGSIWVGSSPNRIEAVGMGRVGSRPLHAS